MEPQTKPCIPFPVRYPALLFGQYKQVVDEAFLINHAKWCAGVNYITNRKVKIGGKLHTKLKGMFMLPYMSFMLNIHYVYFKDLEGIDKETYLKETADMYKQIGAENEKIIKYNSEVHAVRRAIKQLYRDEYVVFDGFTWTNPLRY